MLTIYRYNTLIRGWACTHGASDLLFCIGFLIHKIMKPRFKIKYKELKKFLETLNDKDFQTNWNNNPECKIKKGHSISDIEFFKMDKSKITLDTLIDYGTPFLVDAIGNDLSIIIHTRRKYQLPNGRVIQGLYDRTLINDCHKIYGTAINGYFIIPDKFLEKI